MCGIVGGVAERDLTPILIEGLKRLEYRGYDSAGIAVLDADARINRLRTLGKVRELEAAVQGAAMRGATGIAHTRWATHGEPSEANAHPHMSRDQVALVHNGIIENHHQLRAAQRAAGHPFSSETDTEVIVHAVYDRLAAGDDLVAAVRGATALLQGAYALGVIRSQDPGRLVATRHGSPLVVGLGIGECFIASDIYALLPVTRRFIVLEDGDLAELSREGVRIFDAAGHAVERAVRESGLSADAVDRGSFRHFMLKEIHEQPRAIGETLEGRIGDDRVLAAAFGPEAERLFARTQTVQIVACGTSYHAGLLARYWLEGLAGIPCKVEVASEFRYRPQVVAEDSLFVSVSQSGETADTLAALRQAKALGFSATLAICNVPESSLVRESELVLLTRAGPEIGVASTKAFTTQLVALLLLVAAIGAQRGRLDAATEARIVAALRALPAVCERLLGLDACVAELAESFGDKRHALFLGRGEHYPIALEGALKLKEISYIHAEAYPAGELKHGPLALIDAEMPVVAVAPNNKLLEKLKSNLEEVRARGGQLYVFAAESAPLEAGAGVRVLRFPVGDEITDPIAFTIPLQLLAYHVAVLKGTDVDQPRNLAKSVTVE